jgi:hypothetical protein
MTLVEFEELLDRHGGDLQRWPPGPRAEAVALLQTSGPARQALDVMQEVERLLAVPSAPSVDHDTLAARISQRPQVRPLSRRILKTGWSAAAAALLAIGILVGHTGSINRDDDPATALSHALASTETINVE